jgi:glucose-1-phosphate cytidylyltransferase
MAEPADTPVAILCGGRGTRLQEHTRLVPKPLVEIGGRPIVWHVIRLYAARGFRRFLLLTGHLGEQVATFAAAERWPDGVAVACRDTGPDTPTGGRVHAAADALAAATFCLTYADGVADVDPAAVLAGHAASGAEGTMTVVRPPVQFGVADLDGERITGFREKPPGEHWVNGGFLCLEPAALTRLAPDSVLEREPLAAMAADGRLRAHRHEGFWDCMDTDKDRVLLNDLWERGEAPWRIW